jgi:PAS domain S-box-containing protein
MGMRAELRLLANILDHAPVLICAVDLHGHLQLVSGACQQILGRENDHLVGQFFADIMHPDDRVAVQAACHEARAQPGTLHFESRCLHADGREVIVEWSAFQAPPEDVLLCMGSDVTAQRLETQRMRAQDVLHRAVAAHSFDMMALLNEDCCYTYVGDTILQGLGYRPEELVGLSAFKFMHPDDVASVRASWDALKSQPIFTLSDFRFRTASGEWRWIETSISNQLLNPDIRAYTVNSRDITVQKTRALELAASEQRFQLLFKNNLNPAVIQDTNGMVLDVNPAYLRFLKLPKEQVLHRELTDFLPVGLVSGVKEQFGAALGGQQLTYESVVVHEGEERTLAITNIPLEVEGQIVGVYSTGKDITEMAAAQRLIRQQAARLHQVLESITESFFSVDKECNLTYLNHEAGRLLGLQPEVALGKNLWELYPEAFGGFYHQKYQQALDTGLTLQFETYSNRLNSWFEVKVYPFEEGVSVFFNDITPRVESDRQLKLLALVAQGTLNGVVITDAEGRVEWVNAAFTNDTGYSLAEMRGHKPGALLQGPETEPVVVRHFREQLQQSQPFSLTLLNYTKAGEKLWLAINVTPIHNDVGELTQFIAIQQNITFRKETEARQAQMTQELSRQNRDLQQFTYILSHNLRAPLANALGLATLLPKLDRHSPTFDTSLAHLHQSMGQADTVLQDLNLMLSLRDQPAPAPERIVLAEVCQQAVADLAAEVQQCGGQVNSTVPDELAVCGSRAYVYSIFYNLLSNAIKYRAAPRPLLVDIACFYEEGGRLRLVFTDNGSGFDVAKAGAQVFQLYKRFHTAPRGRGIGLFLVKAHVEAMGGTIEVTSQLDAGTRFLIQLPPC